jgi:hypothetical protein
LQHAEGAGEHLLGDRALQQGLAGDVDQGVTDSHKAKQQQREPAVRPDPEEGDGKPPQ